MAMMIINHLKDQLVYDNCLWPTDTILIGNRATSFDDNDTWLPDHHQRTKPARRSPLAVRKHHLMITLMIIDCQSIIAHDSSAYKTCTTIPLGRPATVPPVFGTSRTLVTWFSSGSFQIDTREI